MKEDVEVMPIVSRKKDQWLLEFKQIVEYRELIKNLVLRDLKVRYKRSVLGFLWVMLNPLLIMAVLYTVFSQVFRGLPNYAAYIISGLVLWNMFSQATSAATQAFLMNSSLLKKVSVPKIIFPISSVLSGLINFCFSIIPLLIILILTGASLSSRVVFLPLCIGEFLLFSIGIALIVSTMVVFFHDVIYIYEVVLLAWMYFSPVFYPIGILPDFVARVMRLNPVYYYLSLFRGLLYDPGTPTELLAVHFAYGLIFAVISFGVGAWVYFVNRDRLLFYL
jgi:ABC-type polysaccharide/polyol phosphate export permease